MGAISPADPMNRLRFNERTAWAAYVDAEMALADTPLSAEHALVMRRQRVRTTRSVWIGAFAALPVFTLEHSRVAAEPVQTANAAPGCKVPHAAVPA